MSISDKRFLNLSCCSKSVEKYKQVYHMVGQMAGMVFSRKTRSEYLSLTGFQPVVQWWPYNSQAITSLPSILRTIYESYLKDEDIRPNIFQLFFRGIAFIYCISLIRSWIYNLSQTTDLKIPLSILFQCHMFNSGKFHCIYRSRVVFFSLLLFTEKFLLEPEMHAFLSVSSPFSTHHSLVPNNYYTLCL